MSTSIDNVCCPGCGASVSLSTKECDYCGRALIISQFSSVRDLAAPEILSYVRMYEGAVKVDPSWELQLALGICLCSLGQHARASVVIDQAINSGANNAEAYFYSAITRLGGTRPALCSLSNAKAAINDLETAKMLEPRGAFHFAAALIKQDYFERKRIRCVPNAAQELADANYYGVSEADKEFVKKLVNLL